MDNRKSKVRVGEAKKVNVVRVAKRKSKTKRKKQKQKERTRKKEKKRIKSRFEYDTSKYLNFKTTEEIKVPDRLIDQVIGQDVAVDIIKKAAKQRRHALLIGEPGTGKSMLAQAMAELMPAENLEDILCYPNKLDENTPLIKTVKTYPTVDEISKDKYLNTVFASNPNPMIGMGRKIVNFEKSKSRVPQLKGHRNVSPLMLIIFLGLIVVIASYMFNAYDSNLKWFILATVLGLGVLYFLMTFASTVASRFVPMNTSGVPKLLVDNTGRRTAPFIDATGAKAGALLGDVKHDPLQSGGLGTPAHLRVEAGAIHRANKGVLFVDEVASLAGNFQQELLTAMQEKKYSITGQSEHSSGALVKTKPAPCDFVLVAAGNMMDLQKLHPAFRSRIRGSGYEIYVKDHMPDTPENAVRLARFVAQEVKRDGKIPHFTKDAVLEIIDEARRKSLRKNSFTLNLRELGGLVRVAGDIAKEKNAHYVNREHVLIAKGISSTLEQQLSRKVINLRKEYQVFATKGYKIGTVNGLAVLGDHTSGLVLPITAEVTPASSKSEGKVIATGKLGTIAKEAVDNVFAIIKKIGKDPSKHDVHIQFLQTYEGVEGDSASIAVAVGVISAMEGIPVNQTVGMTGSLSVRGDVLPVGGLTGKVMACVEAGLKKVIVPESNVEDIYIPKEAKNKIKVIPVRTIKDVLEIALKNSAKKKDLLKRIDELEGRS
ncbi:ATP-dependent protease LonB [Candidatus Micrarchaeota archaeon]|nr:ATP-dependent protease LonB [Candidatus Micrarchaeota archaeon]